MHLPSKCLFDEFLVIDIEFCGFVFFLQAIDMKLQFLKNTNKQYDVTCSQRHGRIEFKTGDRAS